MRKWLVSAILITLAFGVTAQNNCMDVQVECILNDLGGGHYEYVFNVSNANSGSNAVFYWTLDNPLIPAEWHTISWTLPTGWTGSHPGQQVHFFATDNADYNPYRIYSPSAAGCGSSMYQFRWEFTNDGGPMPDCDFGSFDYTFHMQGVDAMTCANVGPSYTCPGTVDVFESSWSLIKSRF